MNSSPVDLSSLRPFKVIKIHDDIVKSLLLLKDGRIASTDFHNITKLIDPKKDFSVDTSLTNNDSCEYSMCQLDDGNVVSASDNFSIKIWNVITGECIFKIKNAHSAWLSKIIKLPLNRFASAANDNMIKIWKSDAPYSDTPIKVLNLHTSAVYSLVYIDKKDIMVSSSFDGILRMWNMTTYECVSFIEGLASDAKNMIQIDDDRVISSFNGKITIVNVKENKVENSIEEGRVDYGLSFVKLRDDKTIICGCNSGFFVVYNIDTKEHQVIRSDHKDDINDLIKYDDETFISCSSDKNIIVWKY